MQQTAYHQHGLALLTALFVVVLATIAATAMIVEINIALRRMNHLQGSEQAQWYACSIEDWVRAFLQRQSQTEPAPYVALGGAWARPINDLPIDRGTASAQLEDLQGRFNINNLGALNPRPYLAQFQRLLANVPGANSAAGTDLGPAIRDWIDVDGTPWEGGAEDDHYLGQNPPYRTSNLLMKSPSELLAVRGMTPEIYAAIQPYITALPTTSAKININTAPLPVLESLSATPGMFAAFIAERDRRPAVSIGDAIARGVLPKDGSASQFIDVNSNYFQLQAVVEVDGVRTRLFSTLNWPRNGAITIISHSFGAE